MKTGHFQKRTRRPYRSLRRRKAGGFLLMEVVLALSVFAVMAVGYTKALSLIRNNSMAIDNRMKVTQILDSTLTEFLVQQRLEEGPIPEERFKYVAEKDMVLSGEIELLELENEQGAILPQMYAVRITGEWYEDGETKTETVEGWRYLRMYQAR